MPIFTLHCFPSFPNENCIFFFQFSKFSVVFDVVELKWLFQYLDYSFSLYIYFCHFFISATIFAPSKRFLSLSVSYRLWKSYSYIRLSLFSFPFFLFSFLFLLVKHLWLLSLMHSIQAEKQCVLLKRENKQPQRCSSLLLHTQYIL